MKKTRYVQIGLGGRHTLFRDALLGTYAASHELVALCDRNPGRLALSQQQARAQFGCEPAGYAAGDFERMLAEQRPDAVIVTTMDSAHDQYICAAMEAGCDVVTEKPMTIDAERCRRILACRRRTGRQCRVTFNYRYSPPRTQLKDLLMRGTIGEVLSVDFHWMLDTHHGADYFRRWHRNKANSGGLMVHKATHHFDLINWWLASVPERVYASGQRRFYTPATADGLGLQVRGERCHGCPAADRCAFRLDLAGNESLRTLYLDTEQHDGYFRDRCVFSPDIDIEDTMTLVADYAGGVKLSYSLNAFAAWEGHTVTFNGTRGRIEHKCEETVYINADGSVPGALNREGTWTRIYPLRAPAYEEEVWQGEGGHGGGDAVLLADLFDPAAPPDPYLRAADERAGAWSILTGIAANQSMREQRPVTVAELAPTLDWPAYATAR